MTQEDLYREYWQMEYEQRENDALHHSPEEDEYHFQLMKQGNPRAEEETRVIIESGTAGVLSHDKLRNDKYLFVAGATLASRAAISAGMNAEHSYNISDFFIQKMDSLSSPSDVRELHVKMIAFYTNEIAKLRQTCPRSGDTGAAISYIYRNLHKRITLADVASAVGLSRTGLCKCFREEMGTTVAVYIRHQRIEAAKNMIVYSRATMSDIAEVLAFSSQSHFVRAFREEVGCTPVEYRKREMAR